MGSFKSQLIPSVAEAEADQAQAQVQQEKDKAAEQAAEDLAQRIAEVEAEVAWLDIGKMISQPPPPLDFVMPGMLAGTVASLVSPGGAGKSFLALELAVLVATSVDVAGLTMSPDWSSKPKRGKVLYIALEDTAPVLSHRLHDIGTKAEGITQVNSFGNPLPTQPKTPEGNSLRHIIDHNRDCSARPDDQHLAVRTSYRQIAIECGLDPDSSSGFKRVRKSMERMANVSIWQQTAVPGKNSAIRWKVGSLLEQVITQDEKSPVLVGINSMLSETILSSKQYTRIQLDEARVLSDPGVLIHQRLCGSVDQGKKWTFSIETLAAYAWPDAALQPHSMRRRKQNVRKVLDELSALNWIVQETTPGNFAITRPK